MTAVALTAGIAGLSRHGSVALADRGDLLAVCEQQRVTRARDAGCNSTGLPDEALDTILERLGHTRRNITRYATAEMGLNPVDGKAVEHYDHHRAHASTAYLSSPYSSATVIVCDHEAPKVSVWQGRGSQLTRIEWDWTGPGFVDVFSRCADVLGFATRAGEQRMEALARLKPSHRDERIDELFSGDGNSLVAAPNWPERVESLVQRARNHGGVAACAEIAAALQGRIIELLLDLLGRIRRHTNDAHVCLAGSLFYHSSVNAAVKQSGLFDDVFVPIDPGNPGLAVGTALHANDSTPRLLSPFLGPAYTGREIKATLDNCKLRYSWEADDDVIDIAVSALRKGTLVAWFEGAMEWGPRALGARSILANPFAPYVLENLSGFLKQRESWRGYALSAIEASVREQFDGPSRAPFMECDYRPRDTARFRHVLPVPGAAVRVHSVDGQAPPRFRKLLHAFGEATGIPCLVNTSFNGFHEPIVCNPRDAVRVFYGSGVDMLVLDQFVLAK